MPSSGPTILSATTHPRPTRLPQLDLTLPYLLQYQDAKGDTSYRRILPIEWADPPTPGDPTSCSKLVAYCFVRKDFRHFRVDRMEHLSVLHWSPGVRAEADAEVTTARAAHWTSTVPW